MSRPLPHDYWVGGRQQAGAGDVDDGWVWVNGELVDMILSGWRDAEPNDGGPNQDGDLIEDGGEDCQILEANNAETSPDPDAQPGSWDATWDDRPCTPSYRYVCESE